MYFIELETSLASRLLFALSVLMSYRALFVSHWTLCVASFTEVPILHASRTPISAPAHTFRTPTLYTLTFHADSIAGAQSGHQPPSLLDPFSRLQRP